MKNNQNSSLILNRDVPKGYCRFSKFHCALIILVMLVTLSCVYKNIKNIRIKNMNEDRKKLLAECLAFINVEVSKCLMVKDRKHQNQLFGVINTRLPIRPVKMTLTTAVFLYRVQTEVFIIKRVLLKPDSSTQEEKIALNLQHKNILNTFESKKEIYVNEKGNKQQILWLFSEFLRERIIQSKVGRNETIIRRILADSLEALAFMHSKGIIHLDLKIANIMGHSTENGIVYKLIDFGYSRDLNKEIGAKKEEVYIHKKAYGTFPYKSPEIVLHNIHGMASDIWSIGAIAWFLSLGKTPFYTESGEKRTSFHKSFLASNKQLTFYKDTSKELKHFIELAMQRNRKFRPTAQNLLKHPFILGTNLESINSSDFDDSGYYTKTSSSEDDL